MAEAHHPIPPPTHEAMVAHAQDLVGRLHNGYLSLVTQLLEAMVTGQDEVARATASALEDAQVLAALKLVRTTGHGRVEIVVHDAAITDVIPSPRWRPKPA